MLSELYSKLNSLKNERNIYENFQREVKAAILTLQPAINSCSQLSDDLKGFLINDVRADGNSLVDDKDNVTKVLNDMNNVILPAISRKLSSISYNISVVNTNISSSLKSEE